MLVGVQQQPDGLQRCDKQQKIIEGIDHFSLLETVSEKCVPHKRALMVQKRLEMSKTAKHDLL